MPMRIGVADLAGGVDALSLEGAAFQIKHSSKRLSPWQFTYLPENLEELRQLSSSFNPVWVFLVCGVDGVVGLVAGRTRFYSRDRRGRSRMGSCQPEPQLHVSC
jgi:hypothetical protein